AVVVRVRNRSLCETAGRVRRLAVADAARAAVIVGGVGRLINVRHQRQVTPQIAHVSQADYVRAQLLLELQAVLGEAARLQVVGYGVNFCTGRINGGQPQTSRHGEAQTAGPGNRARTLDGVEGVPPAVSTDHERNIL